MTRTRPGGTATNEGPADAQGRGRPPMIAKNASGAVAKTEAGTSRGRGGVIVTVTSVTELTGVKSRQCCTSRYPVQTPYTETSDA